MIERNIGLTFGLYRDGMLIYTADTKDAIMRAKRLRQIIDDINIEKGLSQSRPTYVVLVGDVVIG